MAFLLTVRMERGGWFGQRGFHGVQQRPGAGHGLLGPLTVRRRQDRGRFGLLTFDGRSKRAGQRTLGCQDCLAQVPVGLSRISHGLWTVGPDQLPLDGRTDCVRDPCDTSGLGNHRRARVQRCRGQFDRPGQGRQPTRSRDRQQPVRIEQQPRGRDRLLHISGVQGIQPEQSFAVNDVVGGMVTGDGSGGDLGAERGMPAGVEVGGEVQGGGQWHVVEGTRATRTHAPVDRLAHMAAVVDLVDVRIVRNGATLLDGITWQVGEEDRWVIIGPNGAGKTTLMQILGGHLHPSNGTADLLGERLGRVDVFELRPRIGVTSAALAERIPRSERVADVVLTAAYAVSGRWREEYDEMDVERANELLETLRVDHLADRTFGTLSEGERKRVQIARALMTDPELLLLDEPAAGLDVAGREALVATLTGLAQDPYAPATVLVTHHVEEIPVGITHALLLKQGRVVAAGPLRETLTDANLSATFDIALELSEREGRWTVRAS